MPVNAGPEYFAAERRYHESKNIDEKISALEEMIKFLPKHKGSENILSQLRARLAKLKKEKIAKRKSSKRQALTIKKEGAGQVCIIGFANSGKSELLKSLTGVGESSPIPYSTKKPVVGMINFEGVQIQLIEIPSTFDSEYLGIAHNADLVLCLADLSKPEQIGELRKIAQEENFKKVMMVGNKKDATMLSIDNKLNLSAIASAKTGENLGELKKSIWSQLGLIRIHTKSPGKPAEKKPLTLRTGSTVRDVCENVHKDFVKYFRFARVWGSSPFAGAQVGLEHVLKDKDVVEIHTR